jgi:hypothetical protein
MVRPTVYMSLSSRVSRPFHRLQPSTSTYPSPRRLLQLLSSTPQPRLARSRRSPRPARSASWEGR